MFRILAILILGLGIWIGIKVAGAIQSDRCLDAGGQINPRGICIGVQPDE